MWSRPSRKCVTVRFTGKVSGIPEHARKQDRTSRRLARRSRNASFDDFRQSWFYSDSRNDIPLLQKVTDPVAVNPDPALAALAAEKRWPVLRIG